MRLTSNGRYIRTGPLAHVRLAESERRAAEHYLELGKRLAELIIGGAAAVSTVLHGIERGLRALTRTRSTN